MHIYFIFVLMLMIFIILLLVFKLYHINEQISFIKDVLSDIKAGNLNRRMLVQENDTTKQICYDINQIAMDSQSQLIHQKQSEQAYKRLMTSLSHDVKTPLASLVGYLEAVENQIVTGREKDEYIHVASEKAQHLKHFVENLFEWVKLDSGEQVFHFETLDLNELSRNIIVHSEGNKVILRVWEEQKRIKVIITDNGKGITSDNLPHIFERLYQCDNSRSAQGNGLGLAITKELVSAHKGTIIANSTPNIGTEFIISFPKAL